MNSSRWDFFQPKGLASDETQCPIQDKEQQGLSEPGPPPDGGFVAWIQVLLMHLVFFNTWGVANSYGVFQQYYSEHLDVSQSAISWIGSVQMSFIFLIGVAAGRATDAGHFKIIFGAGVLLQLVGLFMTSLCTTYWQIFLAQAVCLGIGNGLTFCPALSVMAHYFKRNRAFAVGVAAAGGGTGGLVYPVVVNWMIDHDGSGFPWTVRVMGFVMLAIYLPCLLLFRPRLPPRKVGPLIDKSAFTELPFVFFSLSMFFSFWGLYFSFFYLGTFARDRIGMDDSINLLMVLNGVGIVGRIIPNIIGDRWTGMFNMLVPLIFAASLMVYCWAAVHSEDSLYIFAVIYGLIAAALQALFPAVATTMTPELNRTGTRVGMIFSIVSLATLTGPAIEGALIDRANGAYLDAQMFAASSIFLGALCATAARFAKTGWKLRIRV